MGCVLRMGGIQECPRLVGAPQRMGKATDSSCIPAGLILYYSLSPSCGPATPVGPPVRRSS